MSSHHDDGITLKRSDAALHASARRRQWQHVAAMLGVAPCKAQVEYAAYRKNGGYRSDYGYAPIPEKPKRTGDYGKGGKRRERVAPPQAWLDNVKPRIAALGWTAKDIARHMTGERPSDRTVGKALYATGLATPQIMRRIEQAIEYGERANNAEWGDKFAAAFEERAA